MNTHSRSCNLDAFAAATGIPVQVFISELQHDGRREGFATQELIDVCLKYRFSVTKIDRIPRGRNPVTGKIRLLFSDEDAKTRWEGYLATCRGVLHGILMGNNSIHHAIPWGLNKNVTLDDLRPHTFYRIDEIR